MFLFELLNLSQGFKKYFDITPAVADSLQEEAYGVRHKVYCEELSFEPVREDHRERDEYDERAVHVLVKSVKFDRYAGCARIVRVDPGAPLSRLPVEKTCEHTIERGIVDPARLPRERIGEISRLAVTSDFRRRKGGQTTPMAISQPDFGVAQMPRFPYLQVGLYLGAIALAKRLGLETLFVLTEPRLANHFARLGVKIRQIGGPVEHRAERVPSMMSVTSIEANLPRPVRPLYEVISDAVRSGVDAQSPGSILELERQQLPRRSASADREPRLNGAV
jgi:N-acyl amino acid synthase of PEP-CTERM/exosortase system